jgi:hypothetical protein
VKILFVLNSIIQSQFVTYYFFSIWSLFFQLFFCPLVKLIFLFNFTL